MILSFIIIYFKIELNKQNVFKIKLLLFDISILLNVDLNFGFLMNIYQISNYNNLFNNQIIYSKTNPI